MTLLVIAGAAWLSACSGGGSNRDSGLFAVGDLLQLVAQSDDAPSGTRFDPTQSGPATLDVLSQGVETGRSTFDSLGFLGGHTAIFISVDKPLPGGALVGTGAFLFRDADAASQALDAHKNVVIPAVMKGVRELPTTALGDKSFGHAFDVGPAGAAGAIYAFQVRNAVFLVPGSGDSVASESLLALAHTIAQRADGVLSAATADFTR